MKNLLFLALSLSTAIQLNGQTLLWGGPNDPNSTLPVALVPGLPRASHPTILTVQPTPYGLMPAMEPPGVLIHKLRVALILLQRPTER